MADAIDCGCDLGNRYQVYPNTGLTGVKKLSGYIVACQQISQVNLPTTTSAEVGEKETG
jgi:hypothetical protein